MTSFQQPLSHSNELRNDNSLDLSNCNGKNAECELESKKFKNTTLDHQTKKTNLTIKDTNFKKWNLENIDNSPFIFFVPFYPL